jgi:hypothetical protein
MTARDEIAAAANTVAAIKAKAFYRQTTKPGDAWVRRDRTDYPNKFGGIVTWQLLAILPQNLADAEQWVETNQPLLVAALGEAISVRSARPVELALDSGTVPVLLIEGQREE